MQNHFILYQYCTFNHCNSLLMQLQWLELTYCLLQCSVPSPPDLVHVFNEWPYFLYPEQGQKQTFFWHPPSFDRSCPRIWWMSPYVSMSRQNKVQNAYKENFNGKQKKSLCNQSVLLLLRDQSSFKKNSEKSIFFGTTWLLIYEVFCHLSEIIPKQSPKGGLI